MTENDLIQIKEEIEKAKQKVSEKTGHLKALKEEMIKIWKVSTTDGAKELLQKKEEELNAITKKFNTNIGKLQEIYDI